MPLLMMLLALPPSWGDDTPKDGKKDPSAKERYDALLKDFTSQQRDIIAEAQKVPASERQKLFDKYNGLGRDFAEKFYKLAEDSPNDPVAADALFRVVQNAAVSPLHAKAAEKVTALVGAMPLKDLTARLKDTRAANPTLIDAVLKRAEKDEKDPLAGDLVAWAAKTGFTLPEGRKAIDRMVEKYPDHDAIDHICQMLGLRPTPDSVVTLKKLLEGTNTKPKVKAAAALALGQVAAAKLDSLGDNLAAADKAVAEAEKYMVLAIEHYGKDNPDQAKAVEQELKALKTLRIGKEVPEITGPDLDGKEFKLSDYRGKVVLLDFWGHW
jgi:hypothetical protein